MLRRTRLSQAVVILVFSMLVLTSQAIVRAQDLEGGASRKDLSGGAGSGTSTRTGPRRPAARAASTVRTVTVTKVVKVTPTTGTLAVAAASNAVILVEPLRGGEGKEGTVPPGEALFIFNDLRPGRYRVAAELDGYQPVEEEVVVAQNRSTPVTLTLIPITYSVTIAANVQSGEVRYALVAGSRDPRTGETKYNVTGETRVTPLQNGRATLPNLRAGTYGVDVRATEVGYQTLLATFTLPGDSTYNVTLPNLRSTGTFNASFLSLEAWETPGWGVSSGKLIASSRGVALPRDEASRHYADFRLYVNFNMRNGVAASFVVRARDARNYYLIQVTGEKASEPYLLRGYIVKDGVAKQFGSTISAHGFKGTLKQNSPFRIVLSATGNQFSVLISDSQTGEVLPLGILEDPNRNFPIGAPGIAVRDNEQNEIDYFLVCTDVSPDCARG
jgi:hypothetical protein